jgi:hypothetical protein
MNSGQCPNYNECALVNKQIDLSDDVYRDYINGYCCHNKESWSECMRFRTKEKINFCPDFVLPDSVMTVEEVIDRFDKENML